VYEVIEQSQVLQESAGWQVASEAYDALLFTDNSPMILYDDFRFEYSSLFNRVVLERIAAKQWTNQPHKQVKRWPNPPLAKVLTDSQSMHALYEAAYRFGDLTRSSDGVVTVHPNLMIVLTATLQNIF